MRKLNLVCVSSLLGLSALAACMPILAASAGSAAGLNKLLVGRYDNAAQVTAGKQTPSHHPPQHVTVTIERTSKPDWQLWRIHMDVDAAVAKEAGSDTSLDAVWAMNITPAPDGKALQLVPYNSSPSMDDSSLKSEAFDKAQWVPLEACALRVTQTKAGIVAQTPPQEMCVAETMGIGGKRAFLPNWIERKGNALQVQLIYFGMPWRVDAKLSRNGLRHST